MNFIFEGPHFPEEEGGHPRGKPWRFNGGSYPWDPMDGGKRPSFFKNESLKFDGSMGS